MWAGGAKVHTANGDWSPQEDAELRGMVEQGGEGQWSVKAQAFSTNRSAGSLRHRWIRLQEQRQRQGPEQHQHQQHQEQEEEEEEGVVLDVHATAGGTLDLALDCPLCRNSIEHAAVDLDGSLACYECMEAFVTHNRTTLRGNPMAAHQIRCACPPVSCFAPWRESVVLSACRAQGVTAANLRRPALRERCLATAHQRRAVTGLGWDAGRRRAMLGRGAEWKDACLQHTGCTLEFTTRAPQTGRLVRAEHRRRAPQRPHTAVHQSIKPKPTQQHRPKVGVEVPQHSSGRKGECKA